MFKEKKRGIAQPGGMPMQQSYGIAQFWENIGTDSSMSSKCLCDQPFIYQNHPNNWLIHYKTSQISNLTPFILMKRVKYASTLPENIS